MIRLLVQRWSEAPLLQRCGLFFALCSYALLWPGVTEPIMTLSAQVSMFGLKAQLFHETRSIWQTVLKLHELGYTPVAILIVSFSVIIPLLKLALIISTWLLPSVLRWRLVGMLGKWSMADVFVVAILVAFFTAKATAELSAELLPGFYWFTAFCLCSVISGQMLTLHTDQNQRAGTPELN
ncbi:MULTISPECIES: paraquat-inducible protein A [Oceanospirillaceae]|jgi:paraquat-inducible protein A|uniref:paraquat-inducible protein A n=1 Tax=Oceanospirillaceae TaxID=135620 RepID=UPI000C38D365|nr:MULTISPECIES: paraquat-inducible protein A [Thalassolituus]PIQ39904.1 MAG: hypothetical protein COW58_09020 [Thalassolituus sp. CG17_big_fil_post_rev_8_21_14_2_50_53_8]MCA6060227.1 paraquat-inducible protein A [Thalassolituus sp. ST750PaO-4]MCB2388559.1 paraquat-inducible protein A [Thalassolituus alkanivorans]MCB2423722.1 paraquat-inducible protein A [Thalassolituus alkanivorans]TVV42702.1 paraquat-inducible protein A [Thalassolituus sp. C2-1]